MVCIDDSAWFLKAWLCLSRFSFLVISGAFFWRISCGGFGTFLFGIWWGCMHEHLVVLFPLMPFPNLRAKWLDFGVFSSLGLEAFLVGFL
jgi:hypothetical protein